MCAECPTGCQTCTATTVGSTTTINCTDGGCKTDGYIQILTKACVGEFSHLIDAFYYNVHKCIANSGVREAVKFMFSCLYLEVCRIDFIHSMLLQFTQLCLNESLTSDGHVYF